MKYATRCVSELIRHTFEIERERSVRNARQMVRSSPPRCGALIEWKAILGVRSRPLTLISVRDDRVKVVDRNILVDSARVHTAQKSK